MDTAPFTTPWDKPVDPAYENFETGWKKWVEDGGMFRYPGTRWHPRNATWGVYPPPRWEMIDRSIPDLEPPSTVLGFWLPQTFKNVHEAAARYPRYPNLVWNPYNGNWREARDTTPHPQPAPPPPIPIHTLPPPAVDAAKRKAALDREREMNAVYDEYARGMIDVITLNQRVAEIDARYARLLG